MTVATTIHVWVFRRSQQAVAWCLFLGVLGVTVAPSIYGSVAYYQAVRVVAPGEDCAGDTSALLLDRSTGRALICQVHEAPVQGVPGNSEPAPDFPYSDEEKDRFLGMAASYVSDGVLDDEDEARLRRYEVSLQYLHGRTDTVPNAIRVGSAVVLLLALLALPAVVTSLRPTRRRGFRKNATPRPF